MADDTEIEAIKRILDAHVLKMQSLEETIRFLAQMLIESGVVDKGQLIARAQKAARADLPPASDHWGLLETLASTLAHGEPFP